MALLKLTAFNAGIKGSIAGTTFQGSISGQVMKTKPTKGTNDSNGKLTLSDAGRVMQSKPALTRLASAWRNLSAANRGGWQMSVANFPFKNKWNETYTGSGYQVYMQMNINLLNMRFPPLDSPPIPAALVNGPIAAVTINAISRVIVTSDIDNTDATQLQISATRSFSNGRKPQKSDFKVIAIFDYSGSQPFNLTNEYNAVFGSARLGGQIWFKFEFRNYSDGRAGIPNFVPSVFG